MFEQLNNEQKQAVQAIYGPVLIVAGAGSGKTKALTERIIYMMLEKGISPNNILAVTFTNKAANEMKHRLEKRIPDLAMMPTIGTFHSICVRILRSYIHYMGYENRFTIFDTNDQLVLMKEIMKEKNIDEKKINPKAVLGSISNAKNELMGPDAYLGQYFSNPFMETVAQLYPIYQSRLARNQALDFDDLIMKTVELFQQFPQVLEEIQNRFQFISVDEYQDTNYAQYTLTKMMASKYRNLCVIGDPDQSIYSWRGANMQNILDFERDYPEALVIKLEQNYRSTSVILEAAHHVIIQNQKRKDKKLWTEREGGQKIRIFENFDEREEALKVAQILMEKMRQNPDLNYKDFAVLYRTNAQSRSLEEAMMRYGIPYKIVGGVKFYLRKEVKDMIAYLRLIVNSDDDISLLRILNVPARKIGPKTIETLQACSRDWGTSLFRVMQRVDEIEALRSKQKVLDPFVKMIQHFQSLNERFSASGVLKHVFQESSYKAMLEEEKTSEAETRVQNIQELMGVATKYDALEPGVSLATFLEEVALISDLDQIEESDNALVLMTLHSAKGLEFPFVFITGLEEGIFPHSRSIYSPEELEEERRLMYVGMTRAMDELILLYSKQRLLFGELKQNVPSQFLSIIPEDYLEETRIKNPYFSFNSMGAKPIPQEGADPVVVPYEEDRIHVPLTELYRGDKVKHDRFGEGLVLEVQGGLVSIAFKNPLYGVKKLALSIAPLQKIDSEDTDFGI